MLLMYIYIYKNSSLNYRPNNSGWFLIDRRHSHTHRTTLRYNQLKLTQLLLPYKLIQDIHATNQYQSLTLP